MTEQEKQELNEKLARWAGFHKVKLKEVYDIGYSTLWENGLGYSEGRLPNFIQSLDACIKWLVPKIEFVEVVIFCDGNRGNDKKGIGYYVQLRDKVENMKGHSLEWHEPPALALCLAIEKIIDKEPNDT